MRRWGPAAATSVALALVTVLRAEGTGPRLLVAGVALAGVLLVTGGAAARAPLAVAWGVAALAAAYAVEIESRGDLVDGNAPLEAAALVLVAELGLRACERWPSTRAGAPAANVRALATLAVVVLGSAALAALVLSATSLELHGGPALLALGGLAAAALVGLISSLARRI